MPVADRIKQFWTADFAEGPLVSLWLPEAPADLTCWDLAAQVAYWKNRQALAEDTVPHLAISNDAETMPALLGAQIEYSAGSTWSHPLLTNPAEGLKIRFDPEAPLYRELVRRLDAAKATPGYAIKMIPLSGLSDLLSSLRGAQDVMMDILEEPDAIAALVAHLSACSRDLLRNFFGRIPLYDGGMAGGLSWLPGHGATVSADMMIMCRPEWFRDFIWPEESRLLHEFDSFIYHLHSGGSGPALAQWIAPHPRVRGIEISHDPAGPDLQSLKGVFTGIQKHTRLLVTCWSRRFTDDELNWLARHLDRHRLYIFQRVETLTEGQAFLERVKARFRQA